MTQEQITTKSATAGMSLEERISHVGGRENEQGYIEFGSPMAVKALVDHVIRDIATPDAHARYAGGGSADYWKAEHLAGNKRIEELENQLKNLSQPVGYASGGEALSEAARTAPEFIWLQVGDDQYYADQSFPEKGFWDTVSWCGEPVFNIDIKYVRSDLAIPAPAVPPAQPKVPDDTLRDAFTAGFRYCAMEWAERDDLYSDVHSEAFRKGMDAALRPMLASQEGE